MKRASLPSSSLSFSDALGGGSGLEQVTVSNGGRVVMMRHQKGVPKLGLPSDQRKALIRSLTTELLRHGRIKTTKVRKAKGFQEGRLMAKVAASGFSARKADT